MFDDMVNLEDEVKINVPTNLYSNKSQFNKSKHLEENFRANNEANNAMSTRVTRNSENNVHKEIPINNDKIPVIKILNNHPNPTELYNRLEKPIKEDFLVTENTLQVDKSIEIYQASPISSEANCFLENYMNLYITLTASNLFDLLML